jgi:hypothetical protein
LHRLTFQDITRCGVTDKLVVVLLQSELVLVQTCINIEWKQTKLLALYTINQLVQNHQHLNFNLRLKNRNRKHGIQANFTSDLSKTKFSLKDSLDFAQF